VPMYLYELKEVIQEEKAEPGSQQRLMSVEESSPGDVFLGDR